MVNCDVCGKKSLMPEKFGAVNICKVCFMKVNGPFWKRTYDRFEDGERNRIKALEASHKKEFPQPVISAINEFFMNQINTMQRCDCCGQPVQKRNTLGKAHICDGCFSAINTSAWKETEYEDNDEVEENRKKVLKIATKRGFPPLVIEGIHEHFNRKLQKGLVCRIDGGVGQILKVFENHCVLITEDDFEIEEMSKRYGKALKRSQTRGSSFTSNAAKAFAFSALLPGGTLAQAGLRAAASAAVTAASDRFVSGKGKFKVIKGNFKIDYHNFVYVDYADCGEKETDIGYIRFCRNADNPFDDVVFLFEYDDGKLERAYSGICKGIEMARQPAPAPQIPSNVAQPIQVSQLSVADELLKFKQLLDMGAITQEEYDIKKKELLNR